MKQIFMLQGTGNNERGWAKLVSAFGRVVLVQQGLVHHAEIWENGSRLYNGPERDSRKLSRLDDMVFSAVTIILSVKRCFRFSEGRAIDLIIATNYGMGLAALLLRKIGKARRVVCFLTDCMPINGSFAIRTYRRITRWLAGIAARHADEVWTVSPRIPTAGVNPRNFVLPIWIDDNRMPVGCREEIGYIGVPSPDHALDILFDICRRRNFRPNIIGDSSYLQSIRHLAPPGTVFHGLMNDPEKINEILSRCFCGYAVYRTTGPQSYSYYGIPSKTFYYFASNTPVVTTNTAHFTQNIEKFRIGRVVEPKPEEIENAMLQLREEFPVFYDAINHFREGWNTGVEKFHRERFETLLERCSGVSKDT